MAANRQTLDDEDGDSSDWLELYNAGPTDVNLRDYYLSDDPDNRRKWSLPPTTLPADGYLLIFCSGKDRTTVGQPLHSNFKISAAGEDLFLTKGSETVQHLSPVDLAPDVAFAAFPGRPLRFIETTAPSPGAANLLGPNIQFSHEAGFYSSAIPLVLTYAATAFSEIKIRYTVDGTAPDGNSQVAPPGLLIDDRTNQPNELALIPTTPDYAGWDGENYYHPHHPPGGPVAKGTVVKAAAFLGGQRVSRVTTQTYFVFPEGTHRYPFPVVALAGPTDSLFSPERGIYVPGNSSAADNLIWTGNYFNKGTDWERAVNFEYFEDGQPILNQQIGLRIHGGKTRGAAQKSLRLYARREYGQRSFDHAFFGDDGQADYRRLLLRSTLGSWTGSIITDAFAHQAVRDLNVDIQEYRPVIMFLNGEYWGVHELREHVGRHQTAMTYGLDDDDVSIYASYGDLTDGSYPGDQDEFIHLRDDYLTQNDITDPAVYDYVKQRIDVDNLIDYWLAEVYFNNKDWPGNNAKMWRSPAYDDRFRWLFFDLDAGMGEREIENNLLAKLLNDTPGWSTTLVRTLLRNAAFREQFLYRARVLLKETFNPERLVPLVGQLVDEYAPAMEEHLARYPGYHSVASWKDNVYHHVTRFVALRACVLEQQLVDYFAIDPFLDCSDAPPPEVSLYPNPTGGLLTVELAGEPTSVYFCQVRNQLGQLVPLPSYVLGPAGGTLNFSGLSSGVYLLSVFDAGGDLVFTKLVVKR